MYEKIRNIVFVLFCIFVFSVFSGCRSTKLTDKGAEFVWNTAELYGQLGESVERIAEHNSNIEIGIAELERNNSEIGNTIGGLRGAIENYVEFCRLVVQTVGKQNEEIENLRNIVGELHSTLDSGTSDFDNTQSEVQD